MPFFRLLRREIYQDAALNEDEIALLVDLTQRVFNVVELELNVTGFWESISSRNKLREEIQKTLLAPASAGMPGVFANRNRMISRIMELAESKNDTILYAE